jgi:hypothetical protein
MNDSNINKRDGGFTDLEATQKVECESSRIVPQEHTSLEKSVLINKRRKSVVITAPKLLQEAPS